MPHYYTEGVDHYGTGGTRPPDIWTQDTITSAPPPILRSRLHLLISWHFISPKRIFYFNVDEEASASGGLARLCRWIRLGDSRPLDRACYAPNRGDATDCY